MRVRVRKVVVPVAGGNDDRNGGKIDLGLSPNSYLTTQYSLHFVLVASMKHEATFIRFEFDGLNYYTY